MYMMPNRLDRIRGRPWFTAADAARALGIRRASARVAVSRWCRRGLLHRLKNDFYVYAPDWPARSLEDRFRIAAFLRVPSYVSLQTALGYHGVSTQVQRGVVESVCLRRPVEFRFHKTRPALFGGFSREDGFFIAAPEKALVDAVHLAEWGSYALDTAALSLARLDRRKLVAALRPYPPQTVAAVRKLCRI